MAIAQEKLEEKLTSERPEKPEVETPREEVQESIDHGDVGNRELERSALEGSEEEEDSREEGEDDTGFFYEDEREEIQEDDELGIGARVAARR